MKRFIYIIGLTVISSITGCNKDDQPRIYTAPKEAPIQSAIPGMSSAGAPATVTPTLADSAATSDPTWVVPESWKQLPAQQMRFATFQVDPADPKLNVVVYTFGPESGQLLPNVNRWEQQIGAPISTDATIGNVVKHIQSNGLEIDYVDIKGAAPAGQNEGQRMLASIIPQGGRMWFTKFAGPESKIAAHQAEYDSFLKSISFGNAASVKQPATSQSNPQVTEMPAGHPPIGGDATVKPADANNPATAAAPVEAGIAAWTIPDGWSVDAEKKMMRVATLHAKSGSDVADLIISKLGANQFGGELANLNRWRGQVGLAPVNDASAVTQSKVAIGDAEGVLMDFTGPAANGQPAKRMLVAQATRGGSTWFYKFIGEAKLIESQKDAFAAFLKSLKFGPASE